MAFKLFKKHCAVCGEEVVRGEALERFGKYLCSSEHAEEYREKIAKEQSEVASRGGCCG